MGNLAIMKHLEPNGQDSGLARLLIPIDATDESRWGLKYALHLAETGVNVEVCLLFIAEPVRNWEVLRFYSEDEVSKHVQARSAVFLEDASRLLTTAGIACRTYFREADSVSGVIDMAEELNCLEIVVPRLLLLGAIPVGLGPKLMSRHCAIPVRLINADGTPLV